VAVAQQQAPETTPSLEDIHSSVPIPRTWWRRFLAFSGPAFLVSVGYMDPGNWGTDLQAGSKFGYRLMWVLLMSNLMALLLQSLATRLGVITGRDLAQACREGYPRRTVYGLWVLTEIAIAATDLAEVIGTIIALKLLFNVPYLIGLAICAADTFLLLALQKRGVRLLELVTLALVGVIAVSFVVEIVMARPDWLGVVRGFVPALDPQNRTDSLYVAIAMLGATVMPHNLYLHSALVQTRAFPQTPEGKALACKYNFFDSALALNGAFFINAAILVLAAASFTHPVETLQEAHQLLHHLWGPLASVLFAVALLASGQSSTLTGTLAGQVVMEGFIRLRLRPWVRRLVTRSLALVPALAVLSLVSGPVDAPPPASASPPAAESQAAENADAGPKADAEPVNAADNRLFQLLGLSQAVLSFQLPFAIVPLVLFTSDRRRMGAFANPLWLKALAWACALIVVGLNVALIVMQTGEWAEAVAEAGRSALWIYGTVGPFAVLLLGFLGWVTLYPLLVRREAAPPALAVPELGQGQVRYRRIGVAVEFAAADAAVLARAAALARGENADLILIHVVEGPVASFYGPDTDDQESRSDRLRMSDLVEHLRAEGLTAQGVLGYGNPVAELVRVASEKRLDLLVMGTHGHRMLADLALGQTVAPLLHQLAIPILVVPIAGRESSAEIRRP
jgi:manganese transport protein